MATLIPDADDVGSPDVVSTQVYFGGILAGTAFLPHAALRMYIWYNSLPLKRSTSLSASNLYAKCFPHYPVAYRSAMTLPGIYGIVTSRV